MRRSGDRFSGPRDPCTKGERCFSQFWVHPRFLSPMCERPGHPSPPSVEIIRDADREGARKVPHRYITEDAFAFWQQEALSHAYHPPRRSTCTEASCPAPQCVLARSLLAGGPQAPVS